MVGEAMFTLPRSRWLHAAVLCNCVATQVYRYDRALSDPLGEGPTGVGGLAWPSRGGGDPAGGTRVGRHQMKMREPAPPPGAPARTLSQFAYPTLYLDTALRAYGHPGLLAVAEAVCGADFVPFT